MAERRYVVFKLGEEKYCSDISTVSGIIEIDNIVRVPDSVSYVEGIINLRGDVIPIINLRRRFNMESTYDYKNCKVIVSRHIQKDISIGFLVDEASQVYAIEDSDVSPVPSIIASKNKNYMVGVGKVTDGIVIILELNKILDSSEIDELNKLEMPDL